MALFAASLNDLGRHVAEEHGEQFAGVVDAAGSSAVALVQTLSGWASFADTSRYDGLTVPFLKRAQISRGRPGPRGRWPPSATSIA